MNTHLKWTPWPAVIPKAVNANNLGLKFNQDPCFFYFKRVFKENSKWPFVSNQSQNVGQKKLQESRSFSYKMELKIDANPGLA